MPPWLFCFIDGGMGKGNRRELPSFVVDNVRKVYPNQDRNMIIWASKKSERKFCGVETIKCQWGISMTIAVAAEWCMWSEYSNKLV